MSKYMFSKSMLSNSMLSKSMFSNNISNGTAISFGAAAAIKANINEAYCAPLVCAPLLCAPVLAISPALVVSAFTPFNKDKMFWCFYILRYGYEEYEINKSNAFSIEKKIKIETVEKLQSIKDIKDKIKELKLKRTELENELVNEQIISVKGLYALCLVHDVSIVYVFGRKYCEINPTGTKKGIIILNKKKEASLRWADDEADFLLQVRNEYWLIENIQKPLNAPSAYTSKELQDICQKLQIETSLMVGEKLKPKTKTKLYEEILQ